jgi:hypothetical protein
MKNYLKLLGIAMLSLAVIGKSIAVNPPTPQPILDAQDQCNLDIANLYISGGHTNACFPYQCPSDPCIAGGEFTFIPNSQTAKKALTYLKKITNNTPAVIEANNRANALIQNPTAITENPAGGIWGSLNPFLSSEFR